jgi:hypothetical protein
MISWFKRPKHEVAIVIPTYRSALEAEERQSLHQCVEVLGSHPIVFVTPEGLELAPEVKALKKAKVVRFDPKYFANIVGYNRLMVSPFFYQQFIDFRYILIHQLDVFVFQDVLLDWCRRGFDYVGAPWAEGEPWIAEGIEKVPLRRVLAKMGIRSRCLVGNGGFSLRNVRSCLLALRLLAYGARTYPENEDMFWSFYVTAYLPWFKIPDPMTALRFSFECEPEVCYERNGRRLPFGCHKWHVYGSEFWRRVMSDQKMAARVPSFGV